MNIKPYDFSYNYNLDWENSDSEKPKSNTPQLPLNFNDLQPTPLTDGNNLKKKTILRLSIPKEQVPDTSAITEEFTEVTVKLEPDLEPLPQKRKNRITLQELKQKLPLINPHFDIESEVGVENCLPCVLSVHNWFISGDENPKEVDRYAKPKIDHMEPIDATRSLLQDPHLEALHNPKIVKQETKDGFIKEYTCLTEDISLTFRPVSLRGILKEVKKDTIPWQQYQKSGETYKSGILFFTHKEDEGTAHFLYFYYFQTKSKNKTEDHFYFIDAQPRPPEILKLKRFLKNYGDSYLNTGKMWYQNNINYDCNKTVKEMHINLKGEIPEKKDPHLSPSIDPMSEEPYVEITPKRKRDLAKQDCERSKKSRSYRSELENIPLTPEPIKENPWARIAKMALSTRLITTEENENSFINEEITNLPSRMPSFMNHSSFVDRDDEKIVGTSEYKKKPFEKPLSVKEKDKKVHILNESFYINNDMNNFPSYINPNDEMTALYNGDVVIDRPKERRRITNQNGEIHEGFFSEGTHHSGKGKITYGNGEIHDGYFSDGFLSKGTITYQNGDFYEGDFSNGVSGNGKITYGNGVTYEGDFSNDKRSGKGSLNLLNNYKYTGDINNGIPHGKGTINYQNGDIYEGEVELGYPHGIGILTNSNGTSYSGHFNYGNAEENGKWTFQNGNTYMGDTVDNIPHGKGTATYFQSGDSYTGDFDRGIRLGDGIYTFKNRNVYKGKFYGSPTGKGIMTFYDEKAIHEGYFINGKLSEGKVTFSNGNIWKGKFVDGKPDGILIQPNGKMIIGSYAFFHV